MVFGVATLAHATWNGQPYNPEQTLDPECSPTDANCRVVQPVITGPGVPAGSLAYTEGTDDWAGLPIGNDGQVLTVVGGQLVWGTPSALGTTYAASEEGLHLSTSTNVFSLALNGSSLSTSANGLQISNSYPGQTSITTLGTIQNGTWQGNAITPQYGGTGATTTPNNGQLLIGNGSGYSLANLTGSNGVQITNGSGTIDVGLSVATLPTATTTDAGDYLVMYENSTGQNEKINYNTLNTALGSGKEPTIAPGLTTQYWRGDKSWQTLDTLAVAENPVNLYFTNARARAALSSGSSALSYATSTGAIGVTTGYNIPLVGITQGDSLVWSGSQWTPTGSTFSISTSSNSVMIGGGLSVSASTNLATTSISGGLAVSGTTSANALSLATALGASSGGTGTSSVPALGQLLMGNGLGGYTFAATSSLAINATALTGTLPITRGGTGVTVLGSGWLYSDGLGDGLIASTTPTVNAFIATSTSLASSIAYRLGIGTTSPVAGLSIVASANVPMLSVGSTTATSLSVAANGFVGIGTSTPQYPLDVRGDVNGTVARFQTTGGSLLCALSAITGLLSCSSDENLKTDITPLATSTLDQVLALNPVSYHWKTDAPTDPLKYGFIAQQVQQIFPQLVTPDPTTGYLTLSLNGFVPYIVKALQQQQTQIQNMSTTNAVSLGSLTQMVANGGLAVSGHVQFGADTVGEATIPAGSLRVSIAFSNPYDTHPIVTISPEADVSGNYWVEDSTANGFAIELSTIQPANVSFAWHAFEGPSDSTVQTTVSSSVPAEVSSSTVADSSDGTVSATTTDSTPATDTDSTSTTEDDGSTATASTSSDTIPFDDPASSSSVPVTVDSASSAPSPLPATSASTSPDT